MLRVESGLARPFLRGFRLLVRPRTFYPVSTKSAMAAASEPSGGSSSPWYAAYPRPRHLQPGTVTREQVLAMLKRVESAEGRDFILVDLRRTDHEVRRPRTNQ